MKISLARTPGWDSIYDDDPDDLTFAPLPQRMRYLAPDALAAIAPIASQLVFTDVFRSPAASVEARARKRGVARPGRSAHNFGLAVDLAVGVTLRRNGWDKRTLDAAMSHAGWHCFRDDGRLDAESWHYTFGAESAWQDAVERVILARYGDGFVLSTDRMQGALAELRLYGGEIDGDPGPLTRRGIALFQRTWNLTETGHADAATQRLLAVVTAEIVPAPT